MPVSIYNIQGTNAAVTTPTQSVRPAVLLPDNCHTIIIYNSDNTNTIYVGTEGQFTFNAAIPAATAIHVPPSSTMTLIVGSLSERPGGSLGLLFDASGGTPTARITYVNHLSA
jgi:hypothetical protein